MNIYGIVSSVLLVVLFGAVVYGYFWHIPRQDKIVEANDAYLQKDYIRVIDSLKDFEIGQMERAQQHIYKGSRLTLLVRKIKKLF
jgi:uncharacterized membrane protein YukC